MNSTDSQDLNLQNFNTIYDLTKNFDIFNNLDNKNYVLFKDLNIIQYKILIGNLYEKFIKLIILCNQFNDYKLLNNSYKIIVNKENYVKQSKINDSCKDGKIDIKLYNKKTKQLLFLSCKYYNPERLLNEYGILEMNEEIKNNTNFKKYSLGLCVRNKNEFIKKYNNSRDINIKKLIDLNYVFDYNYFKNILDNLVYSDVLLKSDNKKLKLRSYQQNIINQIKPGNNLIGACPRSGKSYMIGGFISQNKVNNVLILTPIIKETHSQWLEDIFNKFSDFNSYNKQFIKTGQELKDKLNSLKPKNIFIVSKQLIQNYYKEIDFKPDLLVFDEHDFHGTSDLSTDIIKKFSTTYNIFLTATYFKSECKLEDLNVIKFNYYQLKQLEDGYPNQVYLHPEFNDTEYIHYLTKNFNNNETINFSVLFDIIYENNTETDETKKSKVLVPKSFKNIQQLNEFISMFLSGYNPTTNKQNKNSIYYKLYYSDYPLIKKGDTLIWFLPQDNINDISKLLIELLKKDYNFKNFNYLIVNSKQNINNINEKIDKEEKIVEKYNKQGLIILAGGMLQRGITIKKCSSVFMLNNSESYEKYVQCSYRCLSEGDNKKNGIIVDFDYNRIISLFAYYEDDNININESVINKIKYVMSNQIIYINQNPEVVKRIKELKAEIKSLQDFKKNYIKLKKDFETTEESKRLEYLTLEYNKLTLNENYDIDKKINMMIEYNEKNIKHHIKQFRNIIESIEINIDKETSKLLAEFYYNDKKNKKIKIDETGEKNLPDNSKQPKIEDDKIKKVNEEMQRKQDELNKLKKDILPYIIPLSSVLTYNNEENKILTVLDIIKNDDTLKEIFNNQCEIIYNKSDCLTAIYNIVNKLPKSFNPSNIISSIKYDINKLLVNKDIEELRNFINECLTVKNCEREKNGEVMTPPWLINLMLDKLEEYNPGIFSNKNLKYFDHSAGMGLFFIELFNRLYKNGIDRDYIIKNMLYFSEYNKKNVFLIKLIFGEDVNINCGDTLKLDTLEKWNVEKFDIIMGNPPYNSGGIKSWKGDKLSKDEKNKTIWPDFIKYSIDHLKDNGWLISINPYSWLKKVSKTNYLTKYNIKYLELWDPSESKSKMDVKISLGWFVLNKAINKNNLTEKIYINKEKHLNLKDKVKIVNNYTNPMCFDNIIYKLYTLTKQTGKFNVLHDCIKEKNNKEYTLNELNKNKLYGINSYLIKENKFMFKEVNTPHKNHNKSKIIMPNKTNLKYTFLDEKGNYSLVGTHKYYIIDKIENLKKIEKYFKFKIIHLINWSFKYSGNFVEDFVWNYIPNILKINDGNISENDFYKLLKLTKDEINLINNFK